LASSGHSLLTLSLLRLLHLTLNLMKDLKINETPIRQYEDYLVLCDISRAVGYTRPSGSDLARFIRSDVKTHQQLLTAKPKPVLIALNASTVATQDDIAQVRDWISTQTESTALAVHDETPNTGLQKGHFEKSPSQSPESGIEMLARKCQELGIRLAIDNPELMCWKDFAEDVLGYTNPHTFKKKLVSHGVSFTKAWFKTDGHAGKQQMVATGLDAAFDAIHYATKSNEVLNNFRKYLTRVNVQLARDGEYTEENHVKSLQREQIVPPINVHTGQDKSLKRIAQQASLESTVSRLAKEHGIVVTGMNVGTLRSLYVRRAQSFTMSMQPGDEFEAVIRVVYNQIWDYLTRELSLPLGLLSEEIRGESPVQTMQEIQEQSGLPVFEAALAALQVFEEQPSQQIEQLQRRHKRRRR